MKQEHLNDRSAFRAESLRAQRSNPPLKRVASKTVASTAATEIASSPDCVRLLAMTRLYFSHDSTGLIKKAYMQALAITVP